MKPLFCTWILAIGFTACTGSLFADVRLPNLFSDHMVLQRHQENPVWGTASPGETVTVTIAGQSHRVRADQNGNWRVSLTPMRVADGPCELTVSGTNSVTIRDILIGEVWMCSGQSNMGWSINSTDAADLEIATADYPEIRLLHVPRVGTQIPQTDIDARWKPCTPSNLNGFSAVGYLFGRRLHHALKVPIGLINNAWGGSDLEAWLPRKVLEDAGQDEFLEEWDQYLARYTDETLAQQKVAYERWVADGKPGRKQHPARDVRISQKRPANIYNGVLHPTVGFGIKGVIWCQGESNIGRAYEYRSLFPLLINTWRDLWENAALPFYWVQLADHQAEDAVPAESLWAELREAQSMTLSLPFTGEAVVIDLGETKDIHYRNKQVTARRLSRHALAKDYGFDIASDSPRFNSMTVSGNKASLTFDHVSSRLVAFDVAEIHGFAIAAADKKFVWAEAEIVGRNEVKVWSDEVMDPVAVRYGWGRNPKLNLYDRNSLPVTPFRTDDWPVSSMGKKTLYRPLPKK